MCTGRKWIDVAMFSSRERALVVVARRAGAAWVDADDVEVRRVDVAAVAGERRDSVQLGDGLVVARELRRADRRVAGRSCRAGQSAIAASTSERFAL